MKKILLLALSKSSWLSRLVQASVSWRHPRPLVHLAIHFYFIFILKVNLNEARRVRIKDYESVLDFFTRKLAAKSRPIAIGKKHIISPVDAKVVSSGRLRDRDKYLIKGSFYSINDLLAPTVKKAGNQGTAAKIVKKLHGGNYISQYLSPKDYHRIHMPFDAKIQSVVFLGEETLPVNDFSLAHFGNVFYRNRRAVLFCKAPRFYFALVLITALNVGNIALHFDRSLSEMSKRERKKVLHKSYRNLHCKKGDDIAAFLLGSSVFTVFEKEKVRLHTNNDDRFTLMGQKIGIEK